jgi:hypothetical protein
VEAYMLGNLTEETAKQMVEEIEKIFNASILRKEDVLVIRFVFNTSFIFVEL